MDNYEHQLKLAEAELETIPLQGNPHDYPQILSLVSRYPHPSLIAKLFSKIFVLFESR
jgi:hypothetical protein